MVDSIIKYVNVKNKLFIKELHAGMIIKDHYKDVLKERNVKEMKLNPGTIALKTTLQNYAQMLLKLADRMTYYETFQIENEAPNSKLSQEILHGCDEE